MADFHQPFQASLLNKIHDFSPRMASVCPFVAVKFQGIHRLLQCLNQVIEILVEFGFDIERLTVVCVLVPKDRNDLAGLKASRQAHSGCHMLAGVPEILQIASQIRDLTRNPEWVAAIRWFRQQQIQIVLLSEHDQAFGTFGISQPKPDRLTKLFFDPHSPSSAITLCPPAFCSSDPKRRDHRTDCADRAHRVPVNSLLCSLHGALQNPCRNSQYLVPLWTARHSAMDRDRQERACV